MSISCCRESKQQERLAREGAAVSITYAGSTDKANGVIADIARDCGKGMAIRADSRDAVAVKSAVGIHRGAVR